MIPTINSDDLSMLTQTPPTIANDNVRAGRIVVPAPHRLSRANKVKLVSLTSSPPPLVVSGYTTMRDKNNDKKVIRDQMSNERTKERIGGQIMQVYCHCRRSGRFGYLQMLPSLPLISI